MTVHAVIDTNVIVSAALKPESIPGIVIGFVMNGDIIPVFSQQIITEYRDVLRREKFGFYEQMIDDYLDGLLNQGYFVKTSPLQMKFPDPDDRIFYEAVIEARKKENAFLVTGNIKHFPDERFVVTPRQIVECVNELT